MDKLFTIITLCYTLLYNITAKAQEFTIMDYNTENSFDTIHDVGKEDTPYLPQGTYHWTRYRMMQKLKNIGKVIVAAQEMKPVDIICLEEVENDTVLTYLTRRTPLANVGYNYVMTHSLDARGIDVAFVYSPFSFKLLNHHSLRPATTRATRDVLYVSGIALAQDTLDFYVVHLPSRLNGAEGERNREKVLNMVEESIDSLRLVRRNPNIIILGDFNDGPGAKVLKGRFDGFSNLAASFKPGTYKYKGNWESIDQILVSKSLADSSLFSLRSDVLQLKFLMEEDVQYGGMKPSRTFIGYKYNGGFSDHLPIYLEIKKKGS